MEYSAGDPETRRVLEAAASAGVEFVQLQFTEVSGGLKGLSIPADRLAECLVDGVWFDGSAVEGLARIAESDLFLKPDPTTFAVLPWERPATGRIIGDLITPDGQAFPADPRFVLRRSLALAAKRGWSYRVGAEVEFYLLNEPRLQTFGRSSLAPADQRTYFEAASGRANDICQRAARILADFGYAVISTHHEVSPGQFEIDLAVDDALRTADAIVTLKLIVRTLASQAGLVPTFMPKPLETASGSGIHLAQALFDAESSRNLLADPGSDGGLSGLAEHFIAGQLAHARGMSAVLAPLVNSYKRFIGGDEAPTRVSWAHVNRGAFIRVPTVSPGAGLIEARAPDPSCNPYLAFAVLLAAGIDGIDQGSPLPGPDEADEENSVYASTNPLPSTLGEALDELEWDMIVRSTLGQPVYERLLAEKEQEWLAYRHHVSDWEIDRYLERA